MSSAYIVFGLTLISDRPLPRLDPHFGAPQVAGDADVVHLIVGRLPSGGDDDDGWRVLRRSEERDPSGQPVLVVDRRESDRTCRFRFADGTVFVISHDRDRVWMLWRPPSSLEDAATYLLGPIMGFLLRQRGVVALHASCVAIDGWAVALAGFSGAGKSTSAAAFATLGHPALSDDIVPIRPRDGGGYTVHPDCPILRLWPRSSALVLDQDTRLPPLSTTWDKRYLKLRDHRLPTFDRPCPLGAIYLLDQGWDDPGMPRIEAVPPQPAMMALVARSYGTVGLDGAQRADELEVLADVVTRLPVRRLAATADCEPRSLAGMIADDFRTLQRGTPVPAAAG